MNPAVGLIIRDGAGHRWLVRCAHDGVLGLVPVGFWYSLYWRLRLRTLRLQ